MNGIKLIHETSQKFLGASQKSLVTYGDIIGGCDSIHTYYVCEIQEVWSVHHDFKSK